MVTSWACEVTEILTQRSTKVAYIERHVRIAMTSRPNSNKIPDIHIAVSVVYVTF